MTELKILVVDDSLYARDGLCSIIKTQPDMSIIGTVDEGWRAVEAAEELRPNIVIVNIAMNPAEGIETTRRLRHRFPAIGILCLSTHPIHKENAISAGASGYMLKDCRCDELLGAIRSIAQKMVASHI